MPTYDQRVFVGGGLGPISATVTSLPVGYTLGEERWENGIKYRLFYNDKTQAIPGNFMSPMPLNGGAYTVTVSTTSGSNNHIGACLVHNATALASSYFWGAVNGYIASGCFATGVTLLTNLMFVMGPNGSVNPMTLTIASNTIAGFIGSGNIPMGGCINGPTAGTVAVRQASIYINLS